MASVDWFLLGLYLVLTLVLGLWLARRNSGEDDFFVAGRSLSGWLAGASLAATTFSIETPLYVAGLVGTRGLAGNWEWWSFGLAHVAMEVVFATCGAAVASSRMRPSQSFVMEGLSRPGCAVSRHFCSPCR